MLPPEIEKMINKALRNIDIPTQPYSLEHIVALKKNVDAVICINPLNSAGKEAYSVDMFTLSNHKKERFLYSSLIEEEVNIYKNLERISNLFGVSASIPNDIVQNFIEIRVSA